MAGIFISYRRADSAKDAGRIADRLKAHFEPLGHQVFFDAENISKGADWRDVIRTAIDQSSVMLVLIGKDWLDIEDDDGNKRLHNEDDVVRYEIEFGLKKPSVTVIPVLLDDTAMPNVDALPDDLHELVDRNAEFFRTDNQYFSRDADTLIASVQTNIQTGASRLTQRTPWGFLAWLIGIVIAFGGLYLAFVAILPEDQRLSILDTLGIATLAPTVQPFATPLPTAMPTATPIPPLLDTELSDAITAAASRMSLTNIVSEPRGLLIAPSSEGIAVWGYAGAGGDLFAVDIATQAPIDLSPDDAETVTLALDGVRANALHYDGRWLWVADSSANQLVVLDPQTLEQIDITGNQELSGIPNAITHIGNRVWVSISNQAQVLAFDVDYEGQSMALACAVDVGTAPSQLIPQGQTALWVAYGRTEGQVRKIRVASCQMDEPLALGGRIASMTLSNDALWVVHGENLSQVNLATNTVNAFDVDGVQQVFSLSDALWLVTDDNQLQRYSTERNEPELVISTRSTPTAILSFGVQLWVASEDNTLTLLTIPDYYRPDWLDIAALNDAIWGLTEDSICPLDNSACVALSLDSTPLRFISNATNDGFWVSTDAGRILGINLAGELTDTYTVGDAMLDIVDTGADLWLTDRFIALKIIDTQTEQIAEAANFNITIPDVLFYDGTDVWLGYAMQGRLVTASFDGDTIREGRTLDANFSNLQAVAADDTHIYIAKNGILQTVSQAQGEEVSVVGIANETNRILSVRDRVWVFEASTGVVTSLTQ